MTERDDSSAGEGRDREEILVERLRRSAGQFVSGTDLAQLLGVSRAAVGKRILSLRRKGWEIEAVPNRGYRLISEGDTLDPQVVTPLLNTGWLGRLYLPHDELVSTSDTAAKMAEEGAPHGTVVLADSQTGGRGRLGRSWYSPAGVNLYLSVILRPDLAAADAPLLSLAAAVGVADGIRGYVGEPPTVKWPNDLLYNRRKLAGILLETPGASRHVILGVGINVNVTVFPDELSGSTSLHLERGSAARRAAVLASVLNSLEDWIDRLVADGSQSIIEAWLGLADWIGQPIVVRQPEGDLSGVALGLAPSGALRLRTDDGEEREIVAGTVELTELSE
jgi:BirA family biotin operon repressor/biotin-[acetyl-CoA-carboxylase] ligase